MGFKKVTRQLNWGQIYKCWARIKGNWATKQKVDLEILSKDMLVIEGLNSLATEPVRQVKNELMNVFYQLIWDNSWASVHLWPAGSMKQIC